MTYGNATYDEIMAIAFAQLARWKPKLSEACFTALSVKCNEEWKAHDPKGNPYDIFRGSQMTEFVCNWREIE